MSDAPARPAATVVLVRPSARRFEVFLVRRHDNVAFMGGAHVFPGGRVDPADHSMGEALAYQLAAIRELFEEAGVLLARDVDGGFVRMTGAAADRFAGYRKALAAGQITLPAVLQQERLQPYTDALAMFAHWVTPAVETRRFDTRFFLAVAPPGQEAAHDDGETTDGIWLDPLDAIDRALSGDIALPPPTWTTLRSLSTLADVDAAWTWATSRTVPRIEPGFLVRDDGTRLVLLPGDPLMPAVPGFEPQETRFVLADGRWRPVR